MVDKSQIDIAIRNRLKADVALAALMPDGVWFDVAPPGRRRFVVVTAFAHRAEYGLNGATAFEIFTYLVKAVMLSDSGVTADDAAHAIYAALHDAPLHATDYVDMRCEYVDRIRETEIDGINDVRWQHRGGFYDVWVCES